ncbi:TIGR03086 family metal-binding protein [Actinophytocola xanthii]|uniref:TIGR03086 family protein n=1 Tax=Actinophytocola xanthii TaxID=1912961 RepID=A0A1Q8CQA7_9PSEU|nr:TIGR03086 family metal-binding protein [Actinophytocola xanthii]OLF16547.1 TIGR03086 family protein [Actinophytocola xanthii]
MELHEMMAKAAAAAVEVARNVKPDQLEDPTPCPDWDVRALVNHLMFWSAFRSELAARKQPVPADDPVTEETDFTRDPHWAATLESRLERVTAAWGEPGATEGQTGLAGGSMPAGLIGTMMVGELVVHGWDLARATGQRLEVDDAVAEAVNGMVSTMAPQGREMGVFGAEVAVPAEASPLDRVLGMSGRDPAWTP